MFDSATNKGVIFWKKTRRLMTRKSENSEKYTVLKAHTRRLMNSAVPAIQRMLNADENK